VDQRKEKQRVGSGTDEDVLVGQLVAFVAEALAHLLREHLLLVLGHVVDDSAPKVDRGTSELVLGLVLAECARHEGGAADQHL